MGLDLHRESRHINRVRGGDLTSLWTAQSYRPEVINALKMIRSWPCSSLAQICTNEIGPGPHPNFSPAGHACLKTKNVLGIVVDADNVDFVELADAVRWHRYRIGVEDLVLNLTGTGSIGRVGIYSRHDGPLTNQHLAKLSIEPGTDSGYVCAFLASWFGQRAIEQGITGSTRQLNLANEHVSRIPVPVLDTDTQRYIGDKVRRVGTLRECARALEARVAKVHASYIPQPVGIDFDKCTRRLPSRDLTERLDAHYYPAAVEQYLRQVGGQQKSLETLTSLVANGQTQREAIDGVFQATVANLGRSFLGGEFRTVELPTDSSRLLSAHDLLLCNASHTKGFIGRDVTYCQVDGGVYPSTEVMVLRIDREQVPASFVRQYLTSRIGFLQIQATIRGISAHSYPGDVKLIKLPIPDVPECERAGWFATDDLMLRAGQYVDAASLLTVAATQLVELLIAGQRTESDFLAAQKGLDCGDRSADRAVLQTLMRRTNGHESPLFNDLDSLYALLGAVDDPEGEA